MFACLCFVVLCSSIVLAVCFCLLMYCRYCSGVDLYCLLFLLCHPSLSSLFSPLRSRVCRVVFVVFIIFYLYFAFVLLSSVFLICIACVSLVRTSFCVLLDVFTRCCHSFRAFRSSIVVVFVLSTVFSPLRAYVCLRT